MLIVIFRDTSRVACRILLESHPWEHSCTIIEGELLLISISYAHSIVQLERPSTNILSHTEEDG